MRAHMGEEDELLFPLVSQMLTQRDLEELARAFESVESQEIIDGVHDKYVDLARRLAISVERPRPGGPREHPSTAGAYSRLAKLPVPQGEAATASATAMASSPARRAARMPP